MPIEIRTSFDNAKLRYTLDYIFNERLHCGYTLNPENSMDEACVIAYGVSPPSQISIPDSGFLHPRGLSAKEIIIKTDKQKNVLIFPHENSDDYSFDIFSAIFFMLSRHEEYTCQKCDQYGRFDLQHSLAFKHGFHHRAVVDEWIIQLQERLLKYVSSKEFLNEKASLSLTIDIDMLYSYRCKGWMRNIAGWFRDLSKGHFRTLWLRPAVLLGIKEDPFDTFARIDAISRKSKVPVLFFILTSQQRTLYDKNGSLHCHKASALLKKIAAKYHIGLHPSYYCLDDEAKLVREKQILSDIVNTPITSSRHHFLRITLPKSYHQIIRAGFSHDYTMGFASGHGFRAGTSRPFRFFDLESDQVLPLTVHPFSIMDGSLKDYQLLSLPETEQELLKIASYIQSIHGHFEIILHNETLSERGRWIGWADMLNRVIQQFQSTDQ